MEHKKVSLFGMNCDILIKRSEDYALLLYCFENTSDDTGYLNRYAIGLAGTF